MNGEIHDVLMHVRVCDSDINGKLNSTKASNKLVESVCVCVCVEAKMEQVINHKNRHHCVTEKSQV